MLADRFVAYVKSRMHNRASRSALEIEAARLFNAQRRPLGAENMIFTFPDKSEAVAHQGRLHRTYFTK